MCFVEARAEKACCSNEKVGRTAREIDHPELLDLYRRAPVDQRRERFADEEFHHRGRRVERPARLSRCAWAKVKSARFEAAEETKRLTRAKRLYTVDVRFLLVIGFRWQCILHKYY